MLPAHTLQALDASQLPAVRETIADVLDYEFRYSEPSVMAQVCTGGAVQRATSPHKTLYHLKS